MTTIEEQWSQPTEVSDVDMAFPSRPHVPAWEDIPDEFENSESWLKFQNTWFSRGNIGGVLPKEGVDVKKAMRHLHVIQGCFDLKHEHKEQAVAWLASLWLTDWLTVDEVEEINRQAQEKEQA